MLKHLKNTIILFNKRKIKKIANNINRSRINKVLKNHNNGNNYHAYFFLNECSVEKKCNFWVDSNSAIITQVWNSKKYNSKTTRQSILKNGFIQNDNIPNGYVNGIYLIDYDLLFTYNGNHRTCIAKELNQLKIPCCSRNIKAIELTDDFSKMQFYSNYYIDTFNRKEHFSSSEEYDIFRLIQKDMNLKKKM